MSKTIKERLTDHAAWLERGMDGDGRLVEHGDALAGVALRAAGLTGTALRDADLTGADLTGACLRGTGLFGAWLRDAGLRWADLTGVDLTDAHMANANLRGARLCDADLTGAYLCGAGMADADLTGAWLRDADLDEVNLAGVRLCGADLNGAFVAGARGITSAGPAGRERHIVYAVDHDDRVMVQAGCRWDTAEAVIASIESDYADEPAMRDAYVITVRAMVATLEAQRPTSAEQH